MYYLRIKILLFFVYLKYANRVFDIWDGSTNECGRARDIARPCLLLRKNLYIYTYTYNLPSLRSFFPPEDRRVIQLTFAGCCANLRHSPCLLQLLNVALSNRHCFTPARARARGRYNNRIGISISTYYVPRRAIHFQSSSWRAARRSLLGRRFYIQTFVRRSSARARAAPRSHHPKRIYTDIRENGCAISVSRVTNDYHELVSL